MPASSKTMTPGRGGFGTGKTVLIMTIVVGCFAVLWPKVFYPMFHASLKGSLGFGDDGEECCDVIFERDVTALKAINELCNRIGVNLDDIMLNELKLKGIIGPGSNKYYTKPPPKAEVCIHLVKEGCGINLRNLIEGKDATRVRKQDRITLELIRSYNVSQCFKDQFGIGPATLGTPHVKILELEAKLPSHMRPERHAHLRPDFMHPALREKGRAIFPQQQTTHHKDPLFPSASTGGGQPYHPPQKTLLKEGRPGPIPGVRPPVGSPGHVVTARTGGTMGIVMPIYTIGIIIFFVYTILKVLFRKRNGKCPHKPQPSSKGGKPRGNKGQPNQQTNNSRDYDDGDVDPRRWGEEGMTRRGQQQAYYPHYPNGTNANVGVGGTTTDLPRKTRIGNNQADDSSLGSNGIAPLPSGGKSVGVADQEALLESLVGDDSTGDTEMELLRKRIQETEDAMERLVSRMNSTVSVSTEKLTSDDTGLVSQEHLNSLKGAANKWPEQTAVADANAIPTSVVSDECDLDVDDDDELSDLVTAEDDYSPNDSGLTVPPTRDNFNGRTPSPYGGEDSRVAVIGIETRASLDEAGKYGLEAPPSPIRSSSPLPPPHGHNRNLTPTPRSPTPSSSHTTLIDLPISSQTQLLVSDPEGDDSAGPDSPPMVLSGKMTLSLLGMESLGSNAGGQNQHGHISPDQERRCVDQEMHRKGHRLANQDGSAKKSPSRYSDAYDRAEYEVVGQGGKGKVVMTLGPDLAEKNRPYGMGSNHRMRDGVGDAYAADTHQSHSSYPTNLSEATSADISAMDTLNSRGDHLYYRDEGSAEEDEDEDIEEYESEEGSEDSPLDDEVSGKPRRL